MKTQLEITIDDRILEDTAERIVESMFRAPQYSSERGGAGYETVRTQVRAALQEMDVRPIIDRLLPEIIERITADVLARELRKHIQAQVKKMQDEGTLFDG